MSDEINASEALTNKAIADSPVARPDVPIPEPKKRGRKPMPRDANGNIIREASAASPKPQKAIPTEILTNANVGKAIGGAFSLTSLPLGPHWRLFQDEEDKLGECIGPLARIYGPEELGKWITILMVAPVVVNVVMPRLAVQKMIMDGDVEKSKSRGTILQVRAFLEAEKVLDVEKTVQESAALLKAKIAKAANTMAEAKASEVQQTVNGSVPS